MLNSEQIGPQSPKETREAILTELLAAHIYSPDIELVHAVQADVANRWGHRHEYEPNSFYWDLLARLNILNPSLSVDYLTNLFDRLLEVWVECPPPWRLGPPTQTTEYEGYKQRPIELELSAAKSRKEIEDIVNRWGSGDEYGPGTLFNNLSTMQNI